MGSGDPAGVDESLCGVFGKEVMYWIVVSGGVPGRCSLERLPDRASLRWGLVFWAPRPSSGLFDALQQGPAQQLHGIQTHPRPVGATPAC